ncbi:hypothetical protein DSECCO2_347740 [anaerobic digester metagenome]
MTVFIDIQHFAYTSRTGKIQGAFPVTGSQEVHQHQIVLIEIVALDVPFNHRYDTVGHIGRNYSAADRLC